MSAKHLHQEVLVYLDQLIRSGKYQPGDVLPSDIDLASQRKVSVATVRRAYSELVTRGWVRRVKKRGTVLNDISSLHTKAKVGIILTNESISYLKLMMGITKVLSSKSVSYFCHYHHDRMGKVEELVREFLKNGCTGLLVTLPSPGESNLILRLHTEGFPIVLMTRKNSNFHCIYHDDHKCGFLIGQHFQENGISHPAVIYRDNQVGLERLYGFREAMALNGKTLQSNRALSVPYQKQQKLDDPDFCRRETDWLLKLEPFPDGIFAFNDTYAAAIYHNLLHRGIRVPDQIAIAGIDNTAATLLPFPITSVENGLETIGAESAKLLISLHTNFTTELVQKAIEPTLQIRLSTNKNSQKYNNHFTQS